MSYRSGSPLFCYSDSNLRMLPVVATVAISNSKREESTLEIEGEKVDTKHESK